MMLSAKIFAYFLVLSLLVFIAVIEIAPEQISPVPAEEISPEQSHYAVFYFVCGKFQSVLITTEPPVMGFAGKQDPPELLGLLKATPFERIVELRYVGPECYYSKPLPMEPIL